MSVLVDTPIWWLALRRSPAKLGADDQVRVEEWRVLVRDGRAHLTGVIRQEVLSGIRDGAAFEQLREHLAVFDDVPVERVDHECASSFFNACRAKGVMPTAIDMLICALAVRHDLAVFTTDVDFTRYAALLPVDLHDGMRSSRRR